MKYEKYLHGHGFLKSEIEQLEHHSSENGGNLIKTKSGDYDRVKLLFNTGKDRRLSITKKQNGDYELEVGAEKIRFEKFNELIDHIDKEF
jgi:hypothetical protein